MQDNDIVIVAAKRTPIGNFNGGLASLPASKIGEFVIKSLLSQANMKGGEVSEVIIGQVLTSACGQNPARQASLGAGLPYEIPAWTVNQVCGSGLKTVMLAAQSILTGNSDIVIAGGQENMSLAPHAMFLRSGVKMGNAEMIDTMIKDGLWDIFNNYHMGITAENLANKYKISRQQQDEFSCSSQNKAEKAQKSGAFSDEIIPISIQSKKGDILVEVDEFPRHGTTLESLSKLKPAFSKDGTVTAGNASGINDGAAMVIVMKGSEAKKRGLKPLAKIVSFAQAGVDPSIMGIGPVSASNIALKKAGWTVKDLDIIEANEAFAAQAIAVNNDMCWDNDKVNINGGAIALGHPIGASGTRILVTLLYSLQKQQAKKGLATLCIGGGMGVAMCVERV